MQAHACGCKFLTTSTDLSAKDDEFLIDLPNYRIVPAINLCLVKKNTICRACNENFALCTLISSFRLPQTVVFLAGIFYVDPVLFTGSGKLFELWCVLESYRYIT
eukprot:SAG11_NODE_222_length_12140_cov_26.886554_7_plen_105_part_00